MHRIPGGMSKRSAAGSALVALGLATTSVGFLSTGTASADPGNANGNGGNGTVVVQELDGTDVPDNDPHVSCSFRIEWRGYEAEDANGGALQSTLRFTLQSPDLTQGVKFTDAAGPGSLNGARTELTHGVTLDQDPAGGAGDLDASQVYTLTFDRAPANENQGYHVDVDVAVEDGKLGNNAGKQKVFWVQPCVTPSSPATEPTSPVTEPTETVPTETVPTETVPTETVPTETVPTETVPTETVPTSTVTVLPTESTAPSEPEESEETTTPTVLPTSSTAPVEESGATTEPTVLGTQRTAAPAVAPAVAPTAVDAGLPGDGDDHGVPSSLLILLGAVVAALGLGIGFVPVVARGKHSR